jgi:nucleoside-diphosphate-sugar epimerase
LKILVLGGEGMLGHKIVQTLSSRYPDTTCTVARTLGEPIYQRVDLFLKCRVIDKVDAMDFPRLPILRRATG